MKESKLRGKAMNKSTMIKRDDCIESTSPEEESEESVLVYMVTSALCICILLLSTGFFAGFFYANWNQEEKRRDVAPEADMSEWHSNFLPM